MNDSLKSVHGREGYAIVTYFSSIFALVVTLAVLEMGVVILQPSDHSEWSGLNNAMAVVAVFKLIIASIILVSPPIVVFLAIAKRSVAVAMAVFAALMFLYLFIACSFSPWQPMRQTSLLEIEWVNGLPFWASAWISASIYGCVVPYALVRRSFVRLTIVSIVTLLVLAVIFQFCAVRWHAP
jgi:hypothetical protein